MSQPFLFGSIIMPEDMEHKMKADVQQDLISVRLNNAEHRRVLMDPFPSPASLISLRLKMTAASSSISCRSEYIIKMIDHLII